MIYIKTFYLFGWFFRSLRRQINIFGGGIAGGKYDVFGTKCRKIKKMFLWKKLKNNIPPLSNLPSPSQATEKPSKKEVFKEPWFLNLVP